MKNQYSIVGSVGSIVNETSHRFVGGLFYIKKCIC